MMTTTPLLSQNDIAFVVDLAQRAGKLAASMRESVDVRQKSGPHDLITDADLLLSELILKEMGEYFPDDFIISEEVPPHERLEQHLTRKEHRTWLIDPIDGTDNYVQGDGQYAVMIGLLVNGSAHFGCVYGPVWATVYYGGPGYGCWKKKDEALEAERCRPVLRKDFSSDVRLMMGYRDGKSHPWVKHLAGIQNISSGSVGLRVAKIIEDDADIYLHLSAQLKLWDTAGPVAIALASGLEVGTLDADILNFPLPEIKHRSAVIIGRPGSLEWSRKILSQSLPS